MKKNIHKLLLYIITISLCFSFSGCAKLKYNSLTRYESVIFTRGENLIVGCGDKLLLIKNGSAVGEKSGYDSLEYFGADCFLAQNGQTFSVLTSDGESVFTETNKRFEFLTSINGRIFVLAEDNSSGLHSIAGGDATQYADFTKLYGDVYVGIKLILSEGNAAMSADCIKLTPDGAEIIISDIYINSYEFRNFIDVIYLESAGEKNAVIYSKITDAANSSAIYNLYDGEMNLLGGDYESISLMSGAGINGNSEYAVRGYKEGGFEIFDFNYVKSQSASLLATYSIMDLDAHTAVESGIKDTVVSLVDGSVLSDEYDSINKLLGHNVYVAYSGNSVYLLNSFTGQIITVFNTRPDYEDSKLFHSITDGQNVTLFFAPRQFDDDYIKEIKVLHQDGNAVSPYTFAFGERDVKANSLFVFSDILRLRHNDYGYFLIRYTNDEPVSDYFDMLDIADFSGLLYAKAEKDGKNYFFGLNQGEKDYTNLIPEITKIDNGTMSADTALIIPTIINGTLENLPVLQVSLIYRTPDNSRFKKSYIVYSVNGIAGKSLGAIEIADDSSYSGAYVLGYGKMGVRNYNDLTTDIYKVGTDGISHELTLDGTEVTLKYENTDLYLNGRFVPDYNKPYYTARANNLKLAAFDANGSLLLPAEFEKIEIKSGVASVSADGYTYGVVKIKGNGKYKTLLKNKALFVYVFSDGEFIAYDSVKAKFGYYSASGSVITDTVELFNNTDSSYTKEDLEKGTLNAYFILSFEKDYKVISKPVNTQNLIVL